MPTFPNPKVGKFGAIEFPVSSCAVSCELRDAMHEYPYQDGADAEKMGRKWYEFRIEVPAVDGLKGYDNLYSERLPKLREMFQSGKVAPLRVPTLGTVSAYIRNYKHEYRPRNMTNGVAATLEFREDFGSSFAPENIAARASASVGLSAGALDGLKPKNLIARISEKFDEAISLARQIQGYKDLAENLIGGYLSKLDALLGLIQELDSTLEDIKHPRNYEFTTAFRNLWESTEESYDSVLRVSSFKTYVTPRVMSAGDVAVAVHNDASKGGDILALNVLEDPFAIPAGTTVRYLSE
jgi:prophage DNA circulation protein